MTAPGWRTSSHSVLAAEGACVQLVQVTRVDLRDTDLSGVKTYLAGTRELSTELAQLVATHNGVPPMLDRDDPFLEVVRALPGSHRYAPRSTTALLGNDPRRLLGGRGLRIPLPPTSSGQPQSVTVSLNASAELAGSGFARERVDARYELRYTVGDRSQARRDVREVTVSRGLGLVTQSASAGKRPADAPVPRWGVTAGPGVRPPAPRADGRAPDTLWTTPVRDRPPAIETRLLNDLTGMAKLALEQYLSRSSAGAGTSGSPRPESHLALRRATELRNSLKSERVRELYGALPDWMRNAPVADVADRIAQAHINKGEPVLRVGAGYGLENDASGGSSGAGRPPAANSPAPVDAEAIHPGASGVTTPKPWSPALGESAWRGRVAPAEQGGRGVAPGSARDTQPAAARRRPLPAPPALSDEQDRPGLARPLELPRGQVVSPTVGYGRWARINRPVPGVTTRPSINQNVSSLSQADQQAVSAEMAAFVQQRYPVLSRLNPTGNMVNCNQAVVAVDRMLSHDTQVRVPPSDRPGFYGMDLLQNRHRGRLVPVRNYDDIIDRISGTPGSRGVVYVGWPDGGHIFNVADTEDGVVFLDGQTGGLAWLPADAIEITLMMYHPRFPLAAPFDQIWSVSGHADTRPAPPTGPGPHSMGWLPGSSMGWPLPGMSSGLNVVSPGLRYDVSPRNWPNALRVRRSATGGAGVFFVSDHSGNSVVVKPMPSLAPEVFYADNFIRRVGRVATPRSHVYDANSPDGRTLHDLLSTTSVHNERHPGELARQISRAVHYLVMELANGEPLSGLARDWGHLMALLGDREAAQDIGRLIVLDSFLGNSDRLIFRDYSEHLNDRPDPVNLDNIMYAPGEGIIAIDNDFFPIGDGDRVLRSPNLDYLRVLADERELNHLIYVFLSHLANKYRQANNISPGQRIQALTTALGAAHRNIAAGVHIALSEIGDRAREHEQALGQEQLIRFPGSPVHNWFVGPLARYVSWRFKDIDVTGRPSHSHATAVADLTGYISSNIHGPVFFAAGQQYAGSAQGAAGQAGSAGWGWAPGGARPYPPNEPDTPPARSAVQNEQPAQHPQGLVRGPHIDTAADGTPWASSTHSALDASGEVIPEDERSCVEVTVIALT